MTEQEDAAPGGVGPVVTRLWAWIALPKDRGGSAGIVTVTNLAGALVPLVNANPDILRRERALVVALSRATGQTLVLQRFDLAEAEDVVNPYLETL